MVIAALIVFFFGAGMNEAMTGTILLSMITGFACTINAIEKNKKKYPPNFSTRIHTKKLTWYENISHSSLITKQKEI